MQGCILDEGTRSLELQKTCAMAERMARSLETNWGVIKHDVSKFHRIYHREAFYADNFLKKKSRRILPLVMLRFVKTHLHPTWKLHSNTSKHKIESPLQYLNIKNLNESGNS